MGGLTGKFGGFDWFVLVASEDSIYDASVSVGESYKTNECGAKLFVWRKSGTYVICSASTKDLLGDLINDVTANEDDPKKIVQAIEKGSSYEHYLTVGTRAMDPKGVGFKFEAFSDKCSADNKNAFVYVNKAHNSGNGSADVANNPWAHKSTSVSLLFYAFIPPVFMIVKPICI